MNSKTPVYIVMRSTNERYVIGTPPSVNFALVAVPVAATHPASTEDDDPVSSDAERRIAS